MYRREGVLLHEKNKISNPLRPGVCDSDSLHDFKFKWVKQLSSRSWCSIGSLSRVGVPGGYYFTGDEKIGIVHRRPDSGTNRNSHSDMGSSYTGHNSHRPGRTFIGPVVRSSQVWLPDPSPQVRNECPTECLSFTVSLNTQWENPRCLRDSASSDSRK